MKPSKNIQFFIRVIIYIFIYLLSFINKQFYFIFYFVKRSYKKYIYSESVYTKITKILIPVQNEVVHF